MRWLHLTRRHVVLGRSLKLLEGDELIPVAPVANELARTGSLTELVNNKALAGMASNSNYTPTSSHFYATTSSARPPNAPQFLFPPSYTSQYSNTPGWYYNDVQPSLNLPPAPTIISTRAPAENSVQPKEPSSSRRSRKRRQQEAEDDEPPSPTEEALPPPPHNPDDTSPVQIMRPCSMAGANVAPNMRCGVMVKADYPYRMCESCRTRFKLAELRSNGVRYEGKFVAKELPGEHRKGRGRGKKTFRKVKTDMFSLY